MRRKQGRNSNGEGGISERHDGRYEVGITIDGQRIRRSARTRPDAERILADLRYEARHGLLRSTPDQTVSEFLEGWLMEYAQGRVRDSTYDGYRVELKRWVPYIGQVKLNALTAPDLLRAQRRMKADGISAIGVERSHARLHQALGHAVSWDLIPKTPTAAPDVRPPRAARREKTTLTVDELSDFLEATRDEPYNLLWTVLLHSGLRISEALGLTWKRVDWTRNLLQIREQLLYRPPSLYTLGPLKTIRSRRDISMDDDFAAVLRAYQRGQPANRLGLVFTRPDGEPLNRGAVGNRLRLVLEELGWPRFTLHEMRHTMASLAHREGVPQRVTMERLGHTTSRMTMDVYTHADAAQHREAARQLGKVVKFHGKREA